MWERLGKRNIIALLLVGIGLLSVPLGVDLVQQQQTLRSQAAGTPLTDELRTWARNVNIKACVGFEFAQFHQGNLPTSAAQLDAWGSEGTEQGHNRRINRGFNYKDLGKYDIIEWECLGLSEGTGQGWRDRPDEDLLRHTAAVERTFEQIICRPITRPEWVHWGGRNMPISQLRAELAASEEGLAHTRAGGCGTPTITPGAVSPAATASATPTTVPAVNAPQPPTSLRASGFCSAAGDVTLRWRKGTGATSYNVLVGTTEVAAVIPTNSTIRPYAIFRATRGLSYNWSVQSVNSTGVSREVAGETFRCK